MRSNIEARGGLAAPCVYKPAPLHAGVVHIEEIPDPKPRDLEVVDYLGEHNRIELPNALELEYDGIVDDDIRDVRADVLAAIVNREHPLPLVANTCIRTLDTEQRKRCSPNPYPRDLSGLCGCSECGTDNADWTSIIILCLQTRAGSHPRHTTKGIARNSNDL